MRAALTSPAAVRLRAGSPVLCILLLCAGCAQRLSSTADCGRVYLFPGIEGGAWSLAFVTAALRDAGYTDDLRCVDWDRPIGGIVNLVDHPGNVTRARRAAGDIASYRQENPAAPVDVIGYSGGGGMALLTLEALPPDQTIRHLVLVQPAVSPDYDLMLALSHVDGRFVHFYAPNDFWILGTGTTVFGTIDRGFGPAAGKLGFDLAAAVPDAVLRRRVEQVPWRPEMLWDGHLGFHGGALGYHWNRRHVAPIVVESGPAFALAPR